MKIIDVHESMKHGFYNELLENIYIDIFNQEKNNMDLRKFELVNFIDIDTLKEYLQIKYLGFPLIEHTDVITEAQALEALNA